MKEAMTFGEYLTEIMRKKHISVADLARRLNYRSRTSLSRLMRDETRFDSIEDFMQRIEPVKAWLLTGEELEALKRAMEVSRLGRARYTAYKEIWGLIAEPKQQVRHVELECYGTGRVQTLHELCKIWRSAQKLEMLVVNSGCEMFFGELSAMLRDCPDLDCRIEHYLLVSDASGALAQQLGAVMGVFHDPRYQGYYRTWRSETLFIGGSVHNNVTAILGVREDGSTFTQLLIIREDGKSLLYDNDSAVDLFSFFQRVIAGVRSSAMPLKTEYPEQDVVGGLIAICRRYLNCEKDRAICCIAPDICFELIPCDILKRVMLDSAFRGCDENEPTAAELIEIHQARYENIRSKKKKTMYMFSWEGLKRFARTGRTTDHVAGMRIFTPKERIAILRDVVEQCRSNVYMSIHILHTNLKVRGMTLTTHEGMGVYLLDSNTQYDVVNGHSEAFILMPEFAATLTDFFRDELIEKHAYSEAESIDMLRGLIASVKD